MNFSIEEMRNMIYILGECNKNPLLASRVYAERYPDNRKPRSEAFEKLMHRFNETGNVAYSKKIVQNSITTSEENVLNVLLAVEENPQSSIKQIEDVTNVGEFSVRKILKKHKFHPYHLEIHQELLERDYANRLNFCYQMRQLLRENPLLAGEILFSDEAMFRSNGAVNRHNMHYYATENPHWVRNLNYQNQWSINVWGGILGTHVIGPYFFDNRLTGERYLQFIRDELPVLLEDVNLRARSRMWFQQDGAPPHYFRQVRDYLNTWLPNRWIGRGSQVAWPARSPDLTPLDFFLWGYVKDNVYKILPTTRDDMKDRIRRSFNNIREEVLINVQQSFIRRLDSCIEQEGRQFEQYF